MELGARTMLAANDPGTGTSRHNYLKSNTVSINGLREIAVTVCLALALAALPGLSKAGYVDSPVCRAHLDKIEGKLSTVSMTFDDPAEADATADATDCVAMHGQVRAMLAARNFYKRCATGNERVEQLDLTQGTLEVVTARISANCTSN
jgi:hypothetical protein